MIDPSTLRGEIGDAEVGVILSDLVRLPSVNPMHEAMLDPPFGEAAVGAYVERFARELGLSVARQPVLPGRENVLVILPGVDSSQPLLYECHMDTVPGWDEGPDPFEPRLVDGRLYGRGACDVKGTLAAMLAAFRLLVRREWRPPHPIVLAAVVDEEHQARGVHYLVTSGIRAAGAVVGEPTGLALVVAHKGCVRWRLVTRGRSVHSSKAHLGVNAIDRMVDVLAELRRELGPALERHTHPLVGAPTLSVCTIHGGVAVNVIPDRCVVEIDRRTVPGESLDDVTAELGMAIQKIAARRPELVVEVEPPFVVDPALGTDPAAPIVRQLAPVTRAIVGAAPLVGVPFGTDASKLSQAGIPTVVFGPGSIDVAHTWEEYVELAEVARAAEILAALAMSSDERE